MTTSWPTRALRKEALDLLVKDWNKVFKEEGKTRSSAQSRRGIASRADPPGRQGPPVPTRSQACCERQCGDYRFRRQLPTARRATLAGARALARPVGPDHRMAVHPSDDRAAVGDQHFSVDLDDPAIVHELSSQHGRTCRCSFVGIDNYTDILTDEDIWTRYRTTARFVIWSVALEVVSASAWRF